jgi:hypothetical protein
MNILFTLFLLEEIIGNIIQKKSNLEKVNIILFGNVKTLVEMNIEL